MKSLLDFWKIEFKKSVWQTGFFTCQNQFLKWFLLATQAVKIQFEIEKKHSSSKYYLTFKSKEPKKETPSIKKFLGINRRMFSQVPGHTQNRHLNSNRTLCALLPCPHLAWAATSLTWPTNFETLLLEFFASVPKKPTNVKKTQ